MFKNIFKKEKEILVLSNKSFTKLQAHEIELKTGKIVILSPDVNDVRFLNKEENKGDGKAVFFDEGTTEEFEDLQRKDKFGFKKLFNIK